MIQPRHLGLCNLPDDVLRVISEYCDWNSRLAVTCTNSKLKSLFLGSVKLDQQSSNKFLLDEKFRRRIRSRVVMPRSNLHLEVEIRNFSRREIAILNSVRSVSVHVGEAVKLRTRWSRPLARIKTLTKLSLHGIPFSNVTSLAGLTSLTSLDLSETQVSDVSALASLTNLTQLMVMHTAVFDVSALAALTHLKHLYLNGTQLSEVSVLAGLTNLTELDLSFTEVTDVSPLARLNHLTKLNLALTKIADVSVRRGLRSCLTSTC